MVFYRFLFAIVALLPILWLHRPKLDAGEWGLLSLASLMGVPLQFLLQFKGLALTTVSHASLMVGTMPVILAVGAAVFAGERLDRLGWFSLGAASLGGAMIVFGQKPAAVSGGPTLLGDGLVVLSLMIALGWVLLNKKLMLRHSALVVTAYGLAAGWLMLCVWVPLRCGPPPLHGISMRAWLALAASGVLCTAMTTLLWNWGLTQVPASQAGVFLNLEPLIGSLLGVGLLHETLGPTGWLGGATIVAAALVLTMGSKTRLAPVS